MFVIPVYRRELGSIRHGDQLDEKRFNIQHLFNALFPLYWRGRLSVPVRAINQYYGRGSINMEKNREKQGWRRGCLSRDLLPDFLVRRKMLRRHAQISHASCAYCGALPRKNKASSNTTSALGIGGRRSFFFITISPLRSPFLAFEDT